MRRIESLKKNDIENSTANSMQKYKSNMCLCDEHYDNEGNQCGGIELLTA